MTVTRTSEFDYNNNPKKSTKSTEDEEGLSGLSCYGDEDDKGGVLKDGLSCYGDQNDKVGILEDGFSGLPSSVEEDRLSELSCYGGVGDDKGGILEHGLSGLDSFGVEDVKDGNLEDGFSVLPSSREENGLSELSCYGVQYDKDGILEDGSSGLSCYGVEDVKDRNLEDGFSVLPSSGKENGLSELSCYGAQYDKDGILEDGSSGLSCYGVEDVKDRNLEDGFSVLPSSGEENGLSELSCYGVQYDKDGILEDGSSGLSCYGVEDVKGRTLEDWLSGVPSYGYKDVKGGILEDGFGEKVKKKKKEEGRMYELRDPLVVLGSDIMLLILSCLDARSVALCLIVSSEWRAVASSDVIWSSKCEELWQGKTHLPRIAKVNNLSKLAVISLSAMDGKRKRIRREDLCDHVWEFHFTEAAPEYWRMLDPSWNGSGRPLMRRYFHPDGSHTADPDDKVWGGHECCYTVVTGLLADGNIREHYVRINRSPPLYVTRKEDWSWELSNYLCTYRSLPDADKEDGTGPLLALY